MESQQQCTKSFLLWSIGSCDRSDQVLKHPPERLVWSAPSQTFTPGGPRRHLFDHNGAGCSRQTRSDNILIADPSVCPRGKVFRAVFSGDRSVYFLGSKPDRADPAFEAQHCAPVAGSGKIGERGLSAKPPSRPSPSGNRVAELDHLGAATLTRHTYYLTSFCR